MSNPRHAADPDGQPEIRRASDRLMVILGQALLDEIEKAQNDGENILAWQFGALDALTKQLSGAVTAVVTMLKQLSLSQRDLSSFGSVCINNWSPPCLRCSTRSLPRSGPRGRFPGRRVRSEAGTREA